MDVDAIGVEGWLGEEGGQALREIVGGRMRRGRGLEVDGGVENTVGLQAFFGTSPEQAREAVVEFEFFDLNANHMGVRRRFGAKIYFAKDDV